ncbi:hypothetical protein DIC82_12945 [Clostridium beijerinckii]|nr:hypothetical protein DIC82_12945 [Clostridium beijerinckii]
MKKVFISFLIMALMLTNISLLNISSVQAATTDNTVTTNDNTIKVSLDNIRDIMIENNLDIKIQHNALEIAKEEYHDALDAYDKDSEPDKSNYYDELGVFDEEAYDIAVKAYNTTKTTYETKFNTYKSAKTTYDQKVETKVYAAQDAYIAYLTNVSDAKLQEDTVKSNEKENKVYKLQYENGFISKNKYTSLLQDNTTPVNKLKELKDTEDLARTKLCNTLGISPEENVTFNTDITEDFQVILKINYDDDLGKMLENNIEIEDQNDVIDDYDNEDLYDDKVEQENNKLKLLMNDTETSFKEQYNTLMNSYNSIKSSYDSLNQENNTYSITQTKYDYGFVSQKEVNDAKLTLDTNESALQTKKNELYVNYLRYLQMKEGY